jgi:ubiquinone biosynthesis protein
MPNFKRLEPVLFIETIRRSVELEMDLRLEASAASELAELNQTRDDFRVPSIDWTRTSKRVLTTEWIEATPLSKTKDIIAKGHDPKALARNIIQLFLQNALEDGFFHADMHQGNLFVDERSRLVAVDFGIMGRLDKETRRFLAEILYGFIARDYQRLADIHFDAGYISKDQDRDTFAQALRSVGEPIFGRKASEISMARLLAQLFQVTQVFDMHLQPQLVLLQKNMVVVEGVARDLDPDINIWETSEPVLEEWIKNHLSPEARLKELAETAIKLGPQLLKLPEVIQNLSEMVTDEGIKLHPETLRAMARSEEAKQVKLIRAAWIGAFALIAIALKILLSG